jgi:PadR family transcriptional regulator, regulatory protein PadR
VFPHILIYDPAVIEVRTALLQAVVANDSYGLELIQRVKEATKGRAMLLEGRVYPVLRELESEGLLESYPGEKITERGGRPRIYYRLTAEGRRTARADAKAILGLLKLAEGVA